MAQSETTVAGVEDQRAMVHREAPIEASAPKLAEPPRPQPRRLAVVVAHGMGQQVRFETLEVIARALSDAHARETGEEKPHATIMRVPTPQADHEPKSRELFRCQLAPSGDRPPWQIDIYEAYWAPLTQGKIGLMGTLGFLVQAAIAGVNRVLLGSVRHRRFGRLRTYLVGPGTLLFLLLASYVIASLGLLSAIVVGGLGSHLIRGLDGGWPRGDLLRQTTSEMVFFLLTILVLLAGIGLSTIGRPKVRSERGDKPGALGRTMRVTSYALVWVAVAMTILMGHLMALQLLGNTGNARALGIGPPPTWLWPCLKLAAGGALVAAIGTALFRPIRCRRLASPGPPSPSVAERLILIGTWGGLVLALLGAGGLLCVGAHAIRPYGWPWLAWFPAESAPGKVTGLMTLRIAPFWASMGLILLAARAFIVEFVGDVAIYVSAHKVSRFNDVRSEIQSIALRVGSLVYGRAGAGGEAVYESVAVVGHSLGSVIAYDMLNALLREDHQRPTPWNVSGRTRVLLTTGSPLDKTAFMFRTQASEESDIREALASAVQPLIEVGEVRRRIPWVNIFSDRDWIASELAYYDRPKGEEQPEAPRVDNQHDSEASTPLLAHNQYWENRLFGTSLYRRLVGERAATGAGGPSTEERG